MMEDVHTGSILLVCMDGHGSTGHKVSGFVRTQLEARLFLHPLFGSDVKTAIQQVLLAIEYDMFQLEERFADASGTTLTLAVIRGDKVVVANIGDSRTIVGSSASSFAASLLSEDCELCEDISSSDSDGGSERCRSRSPSSSTTSEASSDRSRDIDDPNLDEKQYPLLKDQLQEKDQPQRTHAHYQFSAENLTVDHKPDRVEEYQRILASGGRVFSVRYADGVVGPPRVWLPNINSPGLAMSRSLGDFAVQAVGVVSTPDIVEYVLDRSRDCMLVLATDGLWDKVSSREAVDIAAMHTEPNRAVASLVHQARSRWVSCDSMSDDISVCVAFLKGTPTSSSKPSSFSQSRSHSAASCSSASASDPTSTAADSSSSS